MQVGSKSEYRLAASARQAHGRACQAAAGNPSQQLHLIGVAGSHGKTTTSCLIAGVLTAAGYRTGVLGTLGYLDGSRLEAATESTPSPEQLAGLLARMVENGCSHAVMEVSHQALAESRLAGVSLDAACVTQVAAESLDEHASLRTSRAEKAKLFDHLTGEGFVVLNADDPGSASYVRELDGPALTIGIQSPAEITAVQIEESISEQTFLLIAGTDSIPVRTEMIGVHHIYNCLTAAAVGLAYGIEVTTVVRGLESVGHVPGRLERIECGQPFGVFVDHARNPAALAGGLKCLRKVTEGRMVCVLGVGRQGSRASRQLMGRAAEQGADSTMVTYDTPHAPRPTPHAPRQDLPEAAGPTILSDVLSGFQDPNRGAVVEDRVEAIHRALDLAQPGDCVLLAGQAYDGARLEDRDSPPEDQEVARRWLYDHAEAIATGPNFDRNTKN